MKRSLVFCIAAALTAFGVASDLPKTVPAGSKIYVDTADGFDHQKPGWAKEVVMGQVHSDDQASIKLVNIKTGAVVFAYSVNKKNTLHGRQTAAEACAKHLKDVVNTERMGITAAVCSVAAADDSRSTKHAPQFCQVRRENC